MAECSHSKTPFFNNNPFCVRACMLPNPSRRNPGLREKIQLKFFFHTSLRSLKRFYEGLHKTFWDTTKKCENKNLTEFLFQYNFRKCTGR